MSDELRGWAWSRRGLTLAQRLVLLALAEHAGNDGQRCYLSLGVLEAMTELSRRGITKALNGLDGALIARDRGGPGRRTSYRLLSEEQEVSLLVAEEHRSPSEVWKQGAGDPLDSDHGGQRSLSGASARGNNVPKDRELSSPPDGEQHSLGYSVPQQQEQRSLPEAREQCALRNQVPTGSELSSADGEPSFLLREQSSPFVGNPVPPNHHDSSLSQKENRGKSSLNAHVSPRMPRTKSREPAQPIPPDWQPGERVFAWASKQRMPHDWVKAQIDEFVVYWTDTGESRTSWEATFINRLQGLHTRETERQDHAPECRLADKDYARGATPIDQIPWLRPAALG